MMRLARRSLPALLALAAAVPACSEDPALPGEPLPVTAPEPQRELPAPAPAPADAADAGSDAGDAGSPAALAGAWEGKYEAKKGRVDMPKNIKDDARNADDGKAASGPGTVELTIAADGEVTGKSHGALGAAGVRGMIDGKMLRASFVPNDPLALRAMTGVLVGIVKGDVIEAELRVAGPDALVVRQANFEIKKK
jgi:hypothetical protein